MKLLIIMFISKIIGRTKSFTKKIHDINKRKTDVLKMFKLLTFLKKQAVLLNLNN